MLASITLQAAAASLFISGAVLFTDIFVDPNAANCLAGDGSVAAPVCSIDAAILIATSGDTIRIAPGTYLENVVLNTDLELIGTGGANVTIIDGGGVGLVVTIQTGVTATLEGLTLTNGSGSPVAGIDVAINSDLTLRNSTVSGNSGAGVGVRFADMLIDGCEILNNSGSGVRLSTSNLAMRGSTISYNGAYYGGGIYANNGDLVVTTSTISHNVAYKGGGMFCNGSAFDFTDSTISNNDATSIGGLAFYNGTAAKRLTNVTVTDNYSSSSFRPPGIYGESPNLRVSHSIIANSTISSGSSSVLDVGARCRWSITTSSGAAFLVGTDRTATRLGLPRIPYSRC